MHATLVYNDEGNSLGLKTIEPLNPCRILSANEFAPTEKSDFTQTGYTQISFAQLKFFAKSKTGSVFSCDFVKKLDMIE